MNKHLPWLSMLSCSALVAGLLAVPVVVVPAAPARVHISPGDVPASRALTPAAAQAFFATHDLKTLWLPDKQEEEGWGGSGYRPGASQNGFFGADHYRIEFAITSVTRDAKQPQVYHVRGKNRYKKRITPFSGTITLQQVIPGAFDASGTTVAAAYTLKGKFEFREDATVAGHGIFRGNVATDAFLDAAGKAKLGWVEESPAGDCGYKFEGQWVSAQTGAAKPVLWGNNFNALARQVLSDFMMGERTPHINPKYAKRGWNRVWDNDEWWADSPGTDRSLSL